MLAQEDRNGIRPDGAGARDGQVEHAVAREIAHRDAAWVLRRVAKRDRGQRLEVAWPSPMRMETLSEF